MTSPINLQHQNKKPEKKRRKKEKKNSTKGTQISTHTNRTFTGLSLYNQLIPELTTQKGSNIISSNVRL
jgi:hypothetical protein